jgi:rhomboid family GlyGly-CTERM serine protease
MGSNQSGERRVGGSRRLAWRLPAILAGLAVLAAIAGDNGREWLAWDREAIAAQAQYWRLLTGHLAHLGTPHLLLNLAGLGLTWFLVAEHLEERDWWLVAAGSLVAMDLGFWFLQPQLAWYVGLSGLLHGMLAAGTAAGLRTGPPEIRLLAVVLVAKIGYEQWFGPLPGSEAASGGNVIVDAHAYGAAGGLLATIPALISARRRASI